MADGRTPKKISQSPGTTWPQSLFNPGRHRAIGQSGPCCLQQLSLIIDQGASLSKETGTVTATASANNLRVAKGTQGPTPQINWLLEKRPGSRILRREEIEAGAQPMRRLALIHKEGSNALPYSCSYLSLGDQHSVTLHVQSPRINAPGYLSICKAFVSKRLFDGFSQGHRFTLPTVVR